MIANAKSLLKSAAGASGFFADNAWLLATFGGFLNAAGRIGTGQYSDRIGRLRAYALNGLVSAACLFAAPWVIGEKSVFLLFVVIGVMFWQYGGTLALMPAIHRRLLWLEEPGPELWARLHRLGGRVLRSPAGWVYSRRDG